LARALDVIADGIDATGAQIKASVLSATFIAARDRSALGVPHLLRALDRELLKEGRVMGDRDRRRLLEQVGQ
jgi:hypothetical protein